MLLCNQTDLFQSFFQIHNKLYGTISFKDLLTIDLQLPIIQRLKDSTKIKQIVEYQESYFKKNTHFNLLSTISIHCCLEDSHNYLTDGQHRYEAIKELSKSYCNESNYVTIEVITVKSKKEYEDNYQIINKNTPLPEFSKTIDKNIPESCFLHFETKYPLIWSSSNRPQRPFMNKNHFQEAVGFLTDELQKGQFEPSSDKLISLIEGRNELMKHWSIQQFRDIKKSKDPEKIKQKCIVNGDCFLGMIPHVADRYGFDWIKSIIHDKTGHEVKKDKKSNPKKNIGTVLKRRVWKYHIGDDKAHVKCLCCRENTIYQGGDWEAGHVVATADLLKQGKEDDISITNLRPICSPCNKSMGSNNMNDYILEYHPVGGGWIPSFFN